MASDRVQRVERPSRLHLRSRRKMWPAANLLSGRKTPDDKTFSELERKSRKTAQDAGESRKVQKLIRRLDSLMEKAAPEQFPSSERLERREVLHNDPHALAAQLRTTASVLGMPGLSKWADQLESSARAAADEDPTASATMSAADLLGNVILTHPAAQVPLDTMVGLGAGYSEASRLREQPYTYGGSGLALDAALAAVDKKSAEFDARTARTPFERQQAEQRLVAANKTLSDVYSGKAKPPDPAYPQEDALTGAAELGSRYTSLQNMQFAPAIGAAFTGAQSLMGSDPRAARLMEETQRRLRNAGKMTLAGPELEGRVLLNDMPELGMEAGHTLSAEDVKRVTDAGVEALPTVNSGAWQKATSDMNALGYGDIAQRVLKPAAAYVAGDITRSMVERGRLPTGAETLKSIGRDARSMTRPLGWLGRKAGLLKAPAKAAPAAARAAKATPAVARAAKALGALSKGGRILSGTAKALPVAGPILNALSSGADIAYNQTQAGRDELEQSLRDYVASTRGETPRERAVSAGLSVPRAFLAGNLGPLRNRLIETGLGVVSPDALHDQYVAPQMRQEFEDANTQRTYSQIDRILPGYQDPDFLQRLTKAVRAQQAGGEDSPLMAEIQTAGKRLQESMDANKKYLANREYDKRLIEADQANQEAQGQASARNWSAWQQAQADRRALSERADERQTPVLRDELAKARRQLSLRPALDVASREKYLAQRNASDAALGRSYAASAKRMADVAGRPTMRGVYRPPRPELATVLENTPVDRLESVAQNSRSKAVTDG